MSDQNTISLAEAQRRIHTLLTLAKTIPPFETNPGLIPRAILLPIEDIRALIANYDAGDPTKELVGIRMYFGINESPEEVFISQELCGMLVPVINNNTLAGKDDLEITLNDSETNQTNIYDFTSPCPRYCDKTSPMNNSN